MTPGMMIPKASFPGPLDYASSAALMNDMIFRGRIKVAITKFATSIQDEASTVPAHNSRFKWANGALTNLDLQVQQFAPAVVLDPAVQTAGDAIDDTSLQGATETAIQ